MTKKIIIALVLFIVAANSMRALQIFATSDEMDHLAYGLKIIQGDSNKVGQHELSKMPISSLNGLFALGEMTILAVLKGKDFNYKGFREVWDEDVKSKSYFILKGGRFFTIICSVLLALLVYIWSKQLYGEKGGLFSLFLYAFSPTILGHSSLVTNDFVNAFTMSLALYCFWLLLKKDSLKNRTLSSVALAISQCAKYTSVFLFPIFILQAIVSKRKDIGRAIKEKTVSSLFTKIIAIIGIYVAGLFIIINVAWLFNGSFKKLEDFTFYSGMFHLAKVAVPDMRMPVPYTYLVGLDHVKDHDESGFKSTPAYLHGEVRNEGFTGYYIWCMLYKEPISFLLILFFSFYLLFKQRKRWNMSDEVFLLIPLAFLFIFFNFFFHRQIGIRFILCYYPILFILCGKVAMDWDKMKRASRNTLIGLMLFQALSTVSWTPYYSSYFNELIGDRKNAYKYLSDSNIDWNQNFIKVDEYLEKYPEAIVSPEKPTIGLILVRVNELSGVFGTREKYQWLRENHKPVGHIGYETLIYEVKNLHNN